LLLFFLFNNFVLTTLFFLLLFQWTLRYRAEWRRIWTLRYWYAW
jgi:hypothetical protein